MAHRSVQREDRRRRVLREETRSGGAPRKRRAAHGDRLFSEAACGATSRVSRICCLSGRWLCFKVFAVGLGLVASVESLYALREQYLSKYPQIDTRWLDLDGGQTLASCVAAVMLAAATMVASIVFHIRRYRMDDYRGRYRIWYPVIVLLALGAADVVTHAHSSLFGLAMSLWPELPIQAPAACWILAWLVSGGLLLVRAAIECAAMQNGPVRLAVISQWVVIRGRLETGRAAAAFPPFYRDGGDRQFPVGPSFPGVRTATVRATIFS